MPKPPPSKASSAVSRMAMRIRATAACAERGGNGHLLPAANGPRQKQVGNVDAADQQAGQQRRQAG